MPPPPPTIIFQDDFSGNAFGTHPIGWTDNFGSTQSGFVEPDPTGFFTHILRMDGGPAIKAPGGFFPSCSVFWAINGSESGTDSKLNFVNTGPSGTSLTFLGGVCLESDNSLSIRSGGASPGNTSSLIVNTGGVSGGIIANGWNFIQLNVSLDIVTISGTDFVRGTFGLALNGVTLISSAIGILVPAAILFNPSALFNWLFFNPPNTNGGLMADVYMTDLTPLNNMPFSFVSNLRATQAFIESVNLPDSPNIRLSQAFIELIDLPIVSREPLVEFPNVRVSQCYIELMIAAAPYPPPGAGDALWSDSDLATANQAPTWTD
jgi:hypothetical protein